MKEHDLKKTVFENVRTALKEDLMEQEDISSLIVPNSKSKAYIVSRQSAVLCGKRWVTEVFSQLDKDIKLSWNMKDGDKVFEGDVILNIEGNSRHILTGERTALNFLQLLSSTATITSGYVNLLESVGTKTKLLDSRKTIPGLRLAQKYAVLCAGGVNHRFGLYDQFLIKENHIRACGSIKEAIKKARDLDSTKKVEIEVTNIAELKEALDAKADIVMLDNFTLEKIKEAVLITDNRVKLEVSGNVSLSNIKDIAKTQVDFISVGALTKNVEAVDFSMQFEK